MTHFRTIVFIFCSISLVVGCSKPANKEGADVPPQLSIIINDKQMAFAPEVRSNLVEKAVALLSSCGYKDLEMGKQLGEAIKKSHLSIKFSSPRKIEVPTEKTTVEVQEMVITFPLNTGGIWVRTDKGVMYFAMSEYAVAQELQKLLNQAK